MLKRLGVVIPSTILTLLMAVGFSTPAFAFVDTTEVMEEPTQVIEEEEPTEEEKIPFTIAGNGEVEDNIVDDPSKEFFTVKTKGGNTFFLVIDRARNSENVYMLSMIDEYDLQEFLDDEERNGQREDLFGGIDSGHKIRVEAAKVKNPPETAKKRGVLPGNRFFRLFLRRLKTHAPPPGRGRRLSPGCKQARFLPTPRREIFFRPSDRRKRGKNGVPVRKSCAPASDLSP